MPEDFEWYAVYSDGEVLRELDPSGDPTKDHGFREVDFPRVVAFGLIPLRTGLPSPVVPISGDKRPIFFRRRTITVRPFSDGSVKEIDRSSVTVLGYLDTLHNRNVKSLMVLYADGSLKLVDDESQINDKPKRGQE